MIFLFQATIFVVPFYSQLVIKLSMRDTNLLATLDNKENFQLDLRSAQKMIINLFVPYLKFQVAHIRRSLRLK